ncbi:sugar ABC transporter permease [Actinoallomurus purpureus]|uniref:carbohydrate ABC transporter permease n=1 Tax=Actinoallomurus purpureus TaxID=478114 RepID=UPI002093B687|nr:sugar ABC transporter permease [Actinoallomurus purpureus]MCO6004237.1 sugar ABC transporter permease [Actinoallomurus purpureus]
MATTVARAGDAVSGARGRSAQRTRRHPSKTRWWVVLAFLSPFVIGLATFVLYPVAATLYYSLTNFQAGSYRPVRFVGLNNYRTLFTRSDNFWIAVRNTVWMVVVMVPLRTAWAMLTAWVITRVKRGRNVYRTLYFLPSMVPPVAAALSFIVLLNPVGPLNRLMGLVGIDGPGWFSDPAWSKPSLVLMALWAAGNTMVIFSAAMLDVPRELYEAADLDGAGAFRKFRSITLPAISPVIYFSLLTGMIYAFQYFTEAFVVSGSANVEASSNELLGYPARSLLFYSTELYQQGFSYFKTGYASAMAWLLFLAIFAATVVFIRVSRRFVHYAGGDR